MKQLLIPLALTLLLIPVIADAKIEFFESNMVINSTRTDVSIGIIFDRTPTGTLEMPLFYRIENFEYFATFRGASCEAVRKPWGTNIVCDFTRTEGSERTLEMKYHTADLVKLVEDQRLFTTTVRVPDDTDKLVVRAYLAQGFVLIDPNKGPLPPYTPVDGLSGSDGRRIFVVWTRNATAKGEGLGVTLAFERVLPQTVTEAPIMLVMGSTALIILLILIVLIKRRREEAVAPVTLLKEDERRIVEYLQTQGGVVKQRSIVNHTGFSKAKVSRLVRDLETRGVLTVKGLGRVNEIKLVTQREAVEKKEAETPKTPVNEPNKPQETIQKKE